MIDWDAVALEAEQQMRIGDVELFNGEFPIRDYADKVDGFFKIPVNPNLPSDKNHITFHFIRKSDLRSSRNPATFIEFQPTQFF